MRVTFITQDDPLYILPFFESFFAQELRPLKVTGIFSCRSMGNRKRSTLLRELALLYGIPGLLKLLALQGGHRAAAAFRLGSMTGRSHSLREVARRSRIPFRRIENPNSPAHFQEIAAHEPHVLVSVACPFVLKRAVLDIPSVAALNIHHAPLPRYKGMMPTFWQMYHGERTVGLTIHTMAEKLDEGAILLQESVAVMQGENMHNLIRRSKSIGGEAMVKLLRQFAEGSSPQPRETSGESSYFTFPNATEMRIFKERGFKVI
jgi:methionyl-tRNA formyltransferase